MRGTTSSGSSAYARVADLRPLVVVGQRRRRGVVGPAPEHELLLAELVEGLLLVLALQRAVVPLVEPPAAPHRQPQPVGDVQRDVRGLDRAAHHRGVHDVGQQVLLAQQLAAAARLGLALRGEADVDPAGEEVLLVPVALAVPEQDQRVRRLGSCGRACQILGSRVVGVSTYGRSRRVRRSRTSGWSRPVTMATGTARPDGVGSAEHVLVAVGRHAGQPGRRVRAAVPGVLPHRRARPHAVVRRAGARRVRPRQHRGGAGRRRAGRPAGPAAGAAGQPAQHRRDAGRARASPPASDAGAGAGRRCSA